MSQFENVEEIFKNITNKFSELSKQVDGINKTIESISLNFTDSMNQVSEQIESLTNILQNIMKISDLGNIQNSLHEIIETFRKELDPLKIQKLMTDFSLIVKKIKEQSQLQTIKGDT